MSSDRICKNFVRYWVLQDGISCTRLFSFLHSIKDSLSDSETVSYFPSYPSSGSPQKHAKHQKSGKKNIMLVFQNMSARVSKSKITRTVQNLQLKLFFRNPKHMASRCHTRPCHNTLLWTYTIMDSFFSFLSGKRPWFTLSGFLCHIFFAILQFLKQTKLIQHLSYK